MTDCALINLQNILHCLALLNGLSVHGDRVVCSGYSDIWNQQIQADSKGKSSDFGDILWEE